ncbi:hypothetical protein KUCAC02_033669 [Chaenocephalus aceratus]|nr:hypothetical protein KUCAC02_033669 [Chaenocephalus aceratus]
MSPLQISLYCRLSLIFFFTSFLFFLDIFTAAIVAETCPHGNGTEVNQSEAGTESGKTDPIVFLAVRCVTGVCCCCINICSFSLGNSSSLTPPRYS